MRTQRGYSLIEIMVAFAILLLVLTITMAAFLERNRRMKQANELIRAYQSLSNEAERVRRLPFADVQPANAFANTEILAPLGPSCETRVEVELKNPQRKDVTLIVRWDDGSGNREAKLGLVRTDTGGTNLW
jgi:prepilin-type N-terminal cleavage/methylation domain-containing protein